jgi:hypothetical protein
MFARTDHLAGGRGLFDAVDCQSGGRDAAHRQHLAWPVCAERPGRFGGPATSGSRPEGSCAETGWRILAVLERAPPSGLARWTGPLIATELGDVHVPQVWRFLRAAVTFRDADGHPSRSRSAPKASLIPAPRRKQWGATGVNAKISSQDDRLSGSFLLVTAAVHPLIP